MNRFLWITENYYPSRGGMAQSCDRITENLRKSGIYIDILHLTTAHVSKKEKHGQTGNYYAIELIEDQAHSINLAWIKTSQLHQKTPYTHLVAFGGNSPLIAAPVFSKWLNIKLITLLRGNDFDQAIFSSRKQDVLFRALKKSDLICTVSNDKTQRIKRLCPQANVAYIPNGISTNWQLLPSDIENAQKWKNQLNIDNEKLVIGLFGVLKAKKGFDFFLEALHMAHLITDIHLIITGEIPSSTQHRLQNSQISYSLLPFQDRYDLLQYYAVCDAIALPSFYDGMPNVLLEAGAVGIPPIVSDIEGLTAVVSGQQYGWVFENNNLKDAATQLLAFAETSNNQRKKIGENLKNRILELFNEKLETQAYLNELNKL